MEEKELLEQYVREGKTNEEIAEILGVSLNAAQGKIRLYGLTGMRSRGPRRKETGQKAEKKKADPSVFPGYNADHHMCRTCRFRIKSTSCRNAGMVCDYLGVTKHSRGCKAEDCDVYEKG